MNRRRFLGLGAGTLAALSGSGMAGSNGGQADPLTLLHLTDIHIRPEHRAPERCRRFLRTIRSRHRDINLVVNTGDSIYAADRPEVTRERVLQQWKLWDTVVMPELKGLPVLHAIGNHDPWLACPEDDAMRGVAYVCSRLKIPAPYYQSRIGSWEIVMLDNSGYSLDRTQRRWFSQALGRISDRSPLLVVSHLPLLSTQGDRVGGTMAGSKPWVQKLAARSGSVVSLCGHLHQRSDEEKGNFRCHCNGALSGSWWEPGIQKDSSYKGVPMGYAIVKLWSDGRSESHYHVLKG